jgi:predicted dehydrogenase
VKLAMIGSYGHWRTVLDSLDKARLELTAVARWGADDPLHYLGRHPAVPATTEVFDDPVAMLEKVRPEIVGVFAPLYRLAEFSTAAAASGAHVISEKPLGTQREDLNRLRETAEKAGVAVVACHDMRCRPAFQAARLAVAQGRIGDPILASGQKSYPFADRDAFYKSRQTYGGSMLWQAIHAVDFIHYVTGKEFRRVWASASNAAHPTHPGMEDAGTAMFDLVGGGHACLWFDYLRPWGNLERSWGDDRLRVAGSQGIVEIVDEGHRALLETPDAREELPLPEPVDLLSSFADSIRDDRACIITPEESFRITEVCLGARDAQDSGQPVDL